jgi:hypothetical protein
MGDRTAIDLVFPVWVFSYGYIYVYRVMNLILALIDDSCFLKMQFFTVINCGLCLLTASGVFLRLCAIVVLWGDLARQIYADDIRRSQREPLILLAMGCMFKMQDCMCSYMY